ncbi:YdiY family protein [Candidatus Zixiibacteriota bacterium]
MRVKLLRLISLPGLVLLGMILPGRVGAQIVNIESILVDEPKDGVEGAVQIGFTLMEGNSEYRQLDGNGIIRWKGGKHIFQLVGGGSYKAAGAKKVADNSMGHFRYGYAVSDMVRLEVLLQVQQNSFVQLNRRVLAGAGFRANVLSSDAGRLDMGLILMHEDEVLNNSLSNPGWRASILLSAGWNLTPSAQLSGQVYYQPLLSESGDFRILNDTGLTVRVLGPLSLQVSFRLAHDSRPPEGVDTTDLSLRNSLAITF